MIYTRIVNKLQFIFCVIIFGYQGTSMKIRMIQYNTGRLNALA